jgi:membrane-bound serine protease (ClpP class)
MNRRWKLYFGAWFLLTGVADVTGLCRKLTPVPAASRIIRLSIEQVVHPITAEIVGDAVKQAQQQRASLVLIQLNTPGGFLDATRKSIEKIIASPVPVVTYVAPSGGRAASAGFFLLESGDLAAMAPGTSTGAASPVLLGQTMDPVLRSKAENDAAALLRGLTSRRRRNSDLGEKAIREAKAFTDKEALDNKLIDLIADNESQLIAKLEGREVTRFDGTKQIMSVKGAEIVDAKLSPRERLIQAIADPNIGFILLILGVLGIYVELTSPGLIFPGVAGAVLLLLGLSSLSVLPINWTGAALIILAMALFALEAKFTSHGILGIGAAVAMVLGSVILVNGPAEVQIHWSTAVSVTLPFAMIIIFLMSLAIKARAGTVLTGNEGMVQQIGVARTVLAPVGQVFIRGEYWDAVSPARIDEGERVRVARVDGLTLHVEPAPHLDSIVDIDEILKGP